MTSRRSSAPRSKSAASGAMRVPAGRAGAPRWHCSLMGALAVARGDGAVLQGDAVAGDQGGHLATVAFGCVIARRTRRPYVQGGRRRGRGGSGDVAPLLAAWSTPPLPGRASSQEGHSVKYDRRGARANSVLNGATISMTSPALRRTVADEYAPCGRPWCVMQGRARVRAGDQHGSTTPWPVTRPVRPTPVRMSSRRVWTSRVGTRRRPARVREVEPRESAGPGR